MNPSYDNSFGSFNTGGAPSGGNSQQPIIVSGEKGRKPIKKILITILLIILIGGGVALAIMLFIGSKQKTKDEAEELYYLIGSTYSSTDGQCSLVTLDVENMYKSKDDYKNELDDCQTKSDRIIELLNSFENKSNTDEYRQLHSNLKTLISNNIVTGDALRKRLSAYEAWHNFKLEANELINSDMLQSSESSDEVVKSLLEIDDQALSRYANEWIEKREALIEAYVLAASLKSDVRYQNLYSGKIEEYELLVNKQFSEVAEDLRLDSEEDGDDISSASFLFNEYVEEKL